ncbi:Solute carrier organic anion transporter family member 3A1 [Halotydeus destructor]|nr:Solute carrier organic anion transporter family member 3A1 [Halotydeus destructor]
MAARQDSVIMTQRKSLRENEDKLAVQLDAFTMSQQRNILDDEEMDTQCGFGSWKPDCLQKFANPVVFLILYSIVGVIHGAAYSHLVGSTSTLEKRYGYTTAMSGLIHIADNISAAILSPFMGFAGRYFSRTKIIGSGMIFMSFSCWFTALPFFIYGPIKDWSGRQTLPNETNSHAYQYCDATNQLCDTEQSATIWPAYAILWIGGFVDGIGYTSLHCLGGPYVDDNVNKKNAPVAHAILATIKLLGPAMGFLLTSACLSWYEDPLYEPEFGQTDPRWIGAWWLGYAVIGTLLFFAALPIFLFPGNLQPKRKRRESLVITKPASTKQDMVDTYKRLFTNPVFMFDMCGMLCRQIGARGFSVTQPRYFESQFRKTASEASLLSGTTVNLAQVVGIMGGGLVIRWLKPGPRALTTFIMVSELIANAGMTAGLFLGCPDIKFHGLDPVTKSIDFDVACNADCQCSRSVLQPVCSADGVTNYFSPCFAGCSLNDTYNSEGQTYISKCTCDIGLDLNKPVTSGWCPIDCGNTFYYYVAILTIGKLIGATSITANTVVGFRCVEDRDKAVASGLRGFGFHLFTASMFNLVFGGIADAACLIWGQTCGKKGNCWLYDNERFRYYLHGSATAFMFIGSLADILVIYYSSRMTNIYGEDEEDHPKPAKIGSEPDSAEGEVTRF